MKKNYTKKENPQSHSMQFKHLIGLHVPNVIFFQPKIPMELVNILFIISHVRIRSQFIFTKKVFFSSVCLNF